MKSMEQLRGEFMKRIRYIVSLMVLLGSLAAIYMTPTVSAQMEIEGDKCDCVWTTGEFGIKEGSTCKVQRCWVDIG